MNGKVIMGGIVTFLGVVVAFLNIWLFLLNGESRPLMWAGIGVLFIVAGVLNVRRARMEMEQN